MLNNIKEKNVDINYYAQKIIKDSKLRKDIINEMLTNDNIMVYYNCYYIINKSSNLKPELFYEYWDVFASLLKHKNSYHRNFGLTLFPNLLLVDKNNYFDLILEDYLSLINDKKYMSAQCLVKNLLRVVKLRPDLVTRIIQLILSIDEISKYKEKQTELLKFDILQIIEYLYKDNNINHNLDRFIISSSFSLSPKTRKKAKEIICKYNIH